MSSRRLLPALALGALLLPAYAEAQGPPPGAPGNATPAAKAEAARLIGDGRKALKEQRYADAAKALSQAVDLDPSPQLRMDLADALTGSFQLLEASRALHAVADAPPNPATTKLQEAAKKALGALEPRIPWLQLDIVGPEEDVLVKIDGKQVDASSEIPLNPGSHKITVIAEGFETAKKKVDLEEGVHQKKKIKLKKGEGKSSGDDDDEGGGGSSGGGSSSHSGGGGSAIHSSGDSGPSIFSPDSPKFPAVLTGLGGAALLIVGAGTGGAAIADASKAKKFCMGTKCSPAAQDYIDKSKAEGNASTAFFIIGGAAVATGVVLFFVLPDGKKHAAIKPTKEAAEPEESEVPAEPAEPPKKKKKKKKPVEEEEPTEGYIAPYIGLGQVGVTGRF